MRFLYSLFALLLFVQVQAQNYNLITGGSIADAEKYTKAYLAPLERGIATASANGMINYTNSEKKIRFVFGINLSTALTPSSQRKFDINDLGLQEFVASDPNNTIAQSISGNDEGIGIETKTTYYKPSLGIPIYKQVPLASFDSPSGIGIPLMPLPVFTLGIYSYGTHLNFNILPNLHTSKDAEFVSYGLSFQHDLETFIPAMKNWPVKLSVSAAFQYTNIKYLLDIQPDESKFGLELGSQNGPYDNQEMEVKMTSIPLQLIAYHDFDGLTIYGGLGYNILSSKVAMKGNYPMYVTDPADILKVNVKDIVDPYSYKRSYNGIRLDIGLNYQIGFMNFKASYSYAKYQSFGIGLGVSI